MACKMCAHCESMLKEKHAVVREGYSYCAECHKCYVCSETNLQNAETFRGVIFCSSCSHRIFQGCSVVKRTKGKSVNDDKKRRAKNRGRRDRHRKMLHRSEPSECVLELTQYRASTESDSKPSNNSGAEQDKNLSVPADVKQENVSLDPCVQRVQRRINTSTTTDVTKDLLDRAKLVSSSTHIDTNSIHKLPCREVVENIKKKIDCTDLRIAELGASTEIANMALRKKSEIPVLIKTNVRKMKSVSLSALRLEENWSEKSHDVDRCDHSAVSSYTTESDVDIDIVSLLALPFRAFKKNILNRSSYVSGLLYRKSKKECVVQKLKRWLFHSEIQEHRKRGVKRLYSTINRNRNPYRLGWVAVKSKPKCCIWSGDCETHPVHCKHYINSHYYRCMRKQAMRLAGPTKSQLAHIRTMITHTIFPDIVRKAFNYKERAEMISEACGTSVCPETN